MSYKLGYSPIHVSRAAKCHTVGWQALFLQTGRDKKHLEIEVEGSLTLVSIIPQVWQRPRVIFRAWILRSPERSECFGGDHPGGYGGAKILRVRPETSCRIAELSEHEAD